MISSSKTCRTKDHKLYQVTQNKIKINFRIEHLLAKNEYLRQQLEESNRTNLALTNDLHKLTIDWDHLRDELSHKEDEWKEDEQAFNDYYNSEQSHLVEMGQDVGAMRRSFRELQTSMRNDLHRMQQEISHTSREMTSACSVVADQLRKDSQKDEACHMQSARIIHDLQSQIDTLKTMNENLKHELNLREQRLADAVAELRSFEMRFSDAENQAAQNTRLNEEVQRLATALRDIAHVVVHDADSTEDALKDAQHLHLSQAINMPLKSPKRGTNTFRNNQAFAEGTVSAVQAVLHKYQLVIHDLQVKLQTAGDELAASKKQFDGAENARALLTEKLMEITDKLDATNNRLSELVKERDTLQRSLENIRDEKHLLEKDKAELNLMIDNVTNDCEKLQATKNKLQKVIDSLNKDKKSLEIDLQCAYKDKEIMEMNLR